jgi:hypothetical protein
MTINENGRLYHITEEEESTLKIKKLLNYCKCKRGSLTNSMISNELYIISKTNGFYSTGTKYMICRIEEQSNGTYELSNLEETNFENLFSLLVLNNLLKKDVEIVQKEIDEYFEEIRSQREKDGIYYELNFEKNNTLSLSLEYKNFYFYTEIHNTPEYRKSDVYIEMPGINGMRIHSVDSQTDIKNFLLKSGMELLEEYRIQEIKNGVIINDEYFENLEIGIYVLENRKADKLEKERRLKKLIRIFESYDNEITTYSRLDYRNAFVHKYDKENNKFLINEEEVDSDIMWNNLKRRGYEHILG